MASTLIYIVIALLVIQVSTHPGNNSSALAQAHGGPQLDLHHSTDYGESSVQILKSLQDLLLADPTFDHSFERKLSNSLRNLMEFIKENGMVEHLDEWLHETKELRKQRSDSKHGYPLLVNRASQESFQESLLNVTAQAALHGFQTQEYSVTTEDGYILDLQRMWKTANFRKDKPPILLMHGLFQSADCWLDSGPDAGLAYLLARNHDLWLGNVRGSRYSRRHETLDPDSDKAYWNFCTDEIGRYDISAMIDKVLNETGASKLNYIGFSQGGGSFFIMCSELPHYCSKANVMISLAPSTRHLLTKAPLFRGIVEFYEKHEQELIEAGWFEALPHGGPGQRFFMSFCRSSDAAVQICQLLSNGLDNRHEGSISKDTFHRLTANLPAGTSVHNLARFGQMVKAKTFHKFDYGPEKNVVLYGSSSPALHNLSAVTVPVVVIYGRNDGISDVGDEKWLVKKLPNVVEAFEVEDPLWTHFDVSYSRLVPKLLLPKIEEHLNSYNSVDK